VLARYWPATFVNNQSVYKKIGPFFTRPICGNFTLSSRSGRSNKICRLAEHIFVSYLFFRYGTNKKKPRAQECFEHPNFWENGIARVVNHGSPHLIQTNLCTHSELHQLYYLALYGFVAYAWVFVSPCR
jgi:hypothetical protein